MQEWIREHAMESLTVGVVLFLTLVAWVQTLRVHSWQRFYANLPDHDSPPEVIVFKHYKKAIVKLTDTYRQYDSIEGLAEAIRAFNEGVESLGFKVPTAAVTAAPAPQPGP